MSRRPNRCDAIALFEREDGVERPAPGQAPSAFRIWMFGENTTDHGPTIFSERSAALLMTEQELRGNLYSIDVDHMSLNATSPVEARKAVGWHRLEVRDDGLWAVQVEWTAAVKTGLESLPPEWRYFSPAYDVDPRTFEVVSYMNTALTNNPATWGVTSLATRAKGLSTMAISKKDMVAFLEHASANQEGAAAICDAILSVIKSAEAPPPAEKPEGEPHKEPDGDEAPAEEEKRDAEAKRDARDAEVLAVIRSIKAERDAEKAAAALAAERAERAELVKAHRMTAEVKTWLENESTSIQSVRDACRALPKVDAPPNPAASQFVTATRRAPDAAGPGLDEREAARLDALMGVRVNETDAIRFDPESRVGYLGVLYGARGREEANRIMARRSPAKKEGV